MQHSCINSNKKYNPAYTKAFSEYLRNGTPIRVPYYILEVKFSSELVEPEEFYIWRTQGDVKVRASHAANEGKIFKWREPPPTGHPVQAYNCRCWAEHVEATFDSEMEDYIKMDDTKTWPKPPIDSTLQDRLPSKKKYRDRGEVSLYDKYGGEWRPHTKDKRHNLHWDYKSSTKFSEWLNIPINNLPTEKGLRYAKN